MICDYKFRMRHIYILLVLCLAGYGFAQPATIRLALFYGINEVHSPANLIRLDSLFGTLSADSVRVSISGHADFLGSTTHNKTLSHNRALAVKEHVLKIRRPVVQLISCEGLGEKQSQENGSALGEPYQRRIDVSVTLIPLRNANPVARSDPKETTVAAEVAEPDTRILAGLEQMKTGETLALSDLNFIPGSHAWTKASEKALINLLSALQARPDMKIEIQGHICCIKGNGDALDYDTNEKRLSENRARAVYDYLVREGIDAGRLQYKGYGHRYPKIEQELNSFHEQMNRRVEIKLLGN